MTTEHDDNHVTDAEIASFAIREWLAAVADTDERRAVREMATAAMKEIGRLQRVERAVQAYIAAPGESDIPGNAGEMYDRLRELVR